MRAPNVAETFENVSELLPPTELFNGLSHRFGLSPFYRRNLCSSKNLSAGLRFSILVRRIGASNTKAPSPG